MRKRLVLLAGLATLALAGCGGSASSTSRASSSAATTTATPTPTASATTSGTSAPSPSTTNAAGPTPPGTAASGCITKSGYAGLYATVPAFASGHNTQRPSQPTPGIAWAQVLSTVHGCVNAYSVSESTSPPQSASDIVFLTGGIYLPADHTQPVQKDGCIVYSSPTLTLASGFKFAKAIGTSQNGNTPAHAEIRLTNDGYC
jgi:hypothetical protein